MLEKKKKSFPLAEAERTLWNTKGVFASRLVLKMEIPATGVCKSLALGRLAQRRHRVGLAEGKVSAQPERSGPERARGREMGIENLAVWVPPHSVNFSGCSSQQATGWCALVQGRLCVSSLEADSSLKGRGMD